MLSFASSLSRDSEALVVFVTEKYEYRDKIIFCQKIVQKIDSFLKTLKSKIKMKK